MLLHQLADRIYFRFVYPDENDRVLFLRNGWALLCPYLTQTADDDLGVLDLPGGQNLKFHRPINCPWEARALYLVGIFLFFSLLQVGKRYFD